MRQTHGKAADAVTHDYSEPCPGQMPAAFEAPAADGGVMRVRLSEDHVAMTRVPEGSGLVRLVPLDDYIGLIVSVTNEGGREVASVSLRHEDPDLSVLLHQVCRDHEVADLLRAWEIWAEALVLDRFVEMANGVLEPVPGHGVPQMVRPVRPAPRRENRHFRTRRPCPVAGLHRAAHGDDTGVSAGW